MLKLAANCVRPQVSLATANGGSLGLTIVHHAHPSASFIGKEGN